MKNKLTRKERWARKGKEAKEKNRKRLAKKKQTNASLHYSFFELKSSSNVTNRTNPNFPNKMLFGSQCPNPSDKNAYQTQSPIFLVYK